MAFGVQIVSRDIVKPSSPTPDHLRTLKLSLLDQLAPPVYVPLIFFYHQKSPPPATANAAHLCRRLKQSLSQALAFFYPLAAGEIDFDEAAIICDDTGGAEFVEARVEAKLGDVLRNPELDQLRKLLPMDGGDEGANFRAQINFFSCGGIALGACASHRLADYNSFVDFMNAWAAISRGDETLDAFRREFGAVARHFPAQDLSESNISPSMVLTGDEQETKRFVFDKETISTLKTAAKSNLVPDPTRVESITAFIWKHFLEKKRSNQLPATTKAAICVSHNVNIRPRADPSLQMEKAFGNAYVIAPAIARRGRTWAMKELAAKLRKEIRNVDGEYIRGLGSGYAREVEELSEEVEGEEEEEVELLNFSSWCRFEVYGVDMGWGKPAWVSTTGMEFMKKMTILMSGRTTTGEEEIEVLMSFPAEDIRSFEKEFKLIANMNNELDDYSISI